MADVQELGVGRHALHQIAEALGIRVIQRRVHLIEQAERRRIELEHGKHQRQRGECLLAAGKQVDRGGFLARRLGDDLHAGIENFLSRHEQARLAATEQAGEHLAEMPVHGVEGLLQHFARLAVNAAYRRIQRFQRQVEVGRLRIQEPLALAAGLEFLQRGHVYRAQIGGRLGEAADFGLQRVGPHAFFQHCRKCLFVGAGLKQLAGVLFPVEACRLLFQAQLVDAASERLQLLLAHQALLFRAAQALRQFLLARARSAQGLLPLDSLLELRLQTLPQVGVLLRCQVGLELLQLPCCSRVLFVYCANR